MGYLKAFRISVLVFLSGVSIYYVLTNDTELYAKGEALKICEWLNDADLSLINFRVGPLALEHLQQLKSENKEFRCNVAQPEHLYGYRDELTVVISTNEDVKLWLIYGRANLRRLYQPRYFQHWTGNRNCSGQLIPDTVLSFSSAA